MKVIQLENVSYGYSAASRIFDRFSLQVAHGQRVSVLGPSGCGKSTLLYLIAGLRLPSSGRVLIDGKNLERPRPGTGMILQDYGLLPWATVAENVGLGLAVRKFYGPDGTHAQREGLSTREIENLVAHWLERLGISDQAQKYPGQLSGGQRQRTAIARTLVTSPNILLMDEPFSSLDAATREDLQALTLRICSEERLTLVLVTHSIDESLALGERVLLLGKPPHAYPDWLDARDRGGEIMRKDLVQWLRGV